MRSLKIAATIAALVAAIFIFYTQFAPNPASESVTEPGAQSDAAALPEASDNGTSVDAQAVESDSSDAQTTQADSAAEDNAEQQNSANTSNPSDVSLAPNPNYPELFAHEVGLVDISEDEYLALIDRLKNDPYLLNEVLNELRIESDPARLKRLAALLGETLRSWFIQMRLTLARLRLMCLAGLRQRTLKPTTLRTPFWVVRPIPRYWFRQ